MANPYSKYTGSRISPVPAGYLAAAAQSAEGVRKAGERFGDMIGAGIAKYYEGKQEARGEEALSKFETGKYQTTWQLETGDEEPSESYMQPLGETPVEEPPTATGNEVLLNWNKTIRDILARTQAEGRKPTADEIKQIEAATAAKEDEAAQPSVPPAPQAPAPAYLPQGQEAEEAAPASQYLVPLDRRLEHLDGYYNETLAEYPNIGSKHKAILRERYDAARANITANFHKDRTYKLQEEELGLRRGALDQKGELAVREAADERADMNALFGVIESQGLVKGKSLAALKGAKTLVGMEKAFNAMPEADKDNMPAQVKTWMYLKTQLEEQGRTPEEVRERQDIYFGGVQPTANERDMELWNKIQADPNRSIEDKIHLGYILGAHTKALIGEAYNKFIEDNPDATQKESLSYARKIGYVGLFDDEQSAMRLEKDRMELTRTKEAFKRWEEDPNKYDVIQTSIPGVQLLQAPGESHWTPFNTGASGKVVRLSSPEEAKKQNDWMVNNDINHVWVPDITGPKGSQKLVSRNPWNFREAAIRGKLPKPGGKSDITPAPEPPASEPPAPEPPAPEPPAPEGSRLIEGATISEDGKSVTAGNKTIPVGGTFQQGETTYRVFIGEDGKAYYEKVK